MEEMLIDALRKAPNKDIQALLLQTYIQEYGALSDTNGEIVRRILMKGADDYERAIEQMEHDMLYEPTYNPEDGSM